MFRVWYSTDILAHYIIAHTVLSVEEKKGNLELKRIYESDANNSKNFHKMPNHLKNILYLDAPDIIVEKDNEPILSLEISTEAGTGHNVFQRFPRLSASVENGVPAFYIYPEAVYVYRQKGIPRWDKLNPLIFDALERVMRIYNIPALFYYFPSFYRLPSLQFSRGSKGLKYCEPNYPSCPEVDSEMDLMFKAMNVIIDRAAKGVKLTNLLGEQVIQDRRDYMIQERFRFTGSKNLNTSPLTATEIIPTSALINYLRQYSGANYDFGDVLGSRSETLIYKVNAKFRGDPYPGALAALDYLKCRRGKTFEERNLNLVMVWGEFNYNPSTQKIEVNGDVDRSVNKFVEEVKKTYQNPRKILLGRDYSSLKGEEIPRYFMQVRFGSSFTKVKHIRVYSYFCDAILFHDGVLWREG